MFKIFKKIKKYFFGIVDLFGFFWVYLYIFLFLAFFWIFCDFVIHVKIIWARTQMGNFQHFFHDCKWHAHIGDVFLNILISYLHFSELVWICSKVFKLTVKRSKGKSRRFTMWHGQNKRGFETRGKSDEWDMTRGRNVIAPKK